MSGRHAYLIQAHGFKERDFDGVCTSAALVFLEHPINVGWGGPSRIWSELMLL